MRSVFLALLLVENGNCPANAVLLLCSLALAIVEHDDRCA